MPHTHNKGMTREQIAQRSLESRIKVLDVIERHERIETNEIVTILGVPRSVLFKWLVLMEESGHVICEQEVTAHKRGSHPTNFYRRGPCRDPLAVFAHGSARPLPAKDAAVKRKFTTAKQIGMVRDEMLSFLFGPAGQVSA